MVAGALSEVVTGELGWAASSWMVLEEGSQVGVES